MAWVQEQRSCVWAPPSSSSARRIVLILILNYSGENHPIHHSSSNVHPFHGFSWYFMVFHGISRYFMVFHLSSPRSKDEVRRRNRLRPDLSHRLELRCSAELLRLCYRCAIVVQISLNIHDVVECF